MNYRKIKKGIEEKNERNKDQENKKKMQEMEKVTKKSEENTYQEKRFMNYLMR